MKKSRLMQINDVHKYLGKRVRIGIQDPDRPWMSIQSTDEIVELEKIDRWQAVLASGVKIDLNLISWIAGEGEFPF